jgi:hypothetical protein
MQVLLLVDTISTQVPRNKIHAQAKNKNINTAAYYAIGNGLSRHHANQDQDDGDSSHLFVWNMKQRSLVAVMM